MSALRVNLFGAPGSGKSTLAAWLYAELKTAEFNCELVREFCKDWAYAGRKPESWDQLEILARQMARERAILSKVSIAITDSPVLMNAAYGQWYDVPAWCEQVEIARIYNAMHPAINYYLLPRVNYSTIGRYQNKHEAEAIDEFFRKFLADKITMRVIDPMDLSDLREVLEEIVQAR